jgi:hypothetical protein
MLVLINIVEEVQFGQKYGSIMQVMPAGKPEVISQR